MYGVHINSDPNNILDEIDFVKKIGGNMVQLFVDPLYKNQQIYTEFKNKLQKNNMKCVVHASYTINLASHWDQYSWSIKQFINEIELAHSINAVGIVVHMGKRIGLSKEESYNNMFTALTYVHNKTKNHNTRIFIETPSGQGSEICYEVEEFAHFFSKLSKHNNEEIRNRFRMCLDTCHIFAAGYDITDSKKTADYLQVIEKNIGIKNIGLIHLNDSKKNIGSKIDRHESLGNGFIGKNGLMTIVKFFKKIETPMILETPNRALHINEISTYFK